MNATTGTVSLTYETGICRQNPASAVVRDIDQCARSLNIGVILRDGVECDSVHSRITRYLIYLIPSVDRVSSIATVKCSKFIVFGKTLIIRKNMFLH